MLFFIVRSPRTRFSYLPSKLRAIFGHFERLHMPFSFLSIFSLFYSLLSTTLNPSFYIVPLFSVQLYTINDYDNYWSLHAAKSASHLRTSKYKITQRSMCERTRRNYRVSSSRLRVTYFHTFLFLDFFIFFLFFRADRKKKHRRDGHRCFLPFRFVIARCACVTLIVKYIYSV